MAKSLVALGTAAAIGAAALTTSTPAAAHTIGHTQGPTINPTRGPTTSHMRGPTTSDMHCPTSDMRGGPMTSDIRSIAPTTGSDLLGLTVSKKCNRPPTR
jgi:hypothetical protein